MTETQKCRRCHAQRDKSLYVQGGRTCQICRDRTTKQRREKEAENRRKKALELYHAKRVKAPPRWCNTCLEKKEEKYFRVDIDTGEKSDDCYSCVVKMRDRSAIHSKKQGESWEELEARLMKGANFSNAIYKSSE